MWSTHKPVSNIAGGQNFLNKETMKLQAIWTLFPETFKQWSEDKASRLAAALAYYTVFSIAPLLIIVIRDK